MMQAPGWRSLLLSHLTVQLKRSNDGASSPSVEAAVGGKATRDTLPLSSCSTRLFHYISLTFSIQDSHYVNELLIVFFSFFPASQSFHQRCSFLIENLLLMRRLSILLHVSALVLLFSTHKNTKTKQKQRSSCQETKVCVEKRPTSWCM